jgi:uncharacterized protein YjbI with pentapeptide repeats
MANPEHLEILRQGVYAWNKWRKENPDIRPDLQKADLRGANLRRADLRRAILHQAKLARATLIDANLGGATLRMANLRAADLAHAFLNEGDLRGATLVTANLRGADLSGADLSNGSACGANLRGVDLREACLIGADLRETDLRRAELSGADLNRANLSRADLTGAVLGTSASYLRPANLSEVDARKTIFTREGEPVGVGSFLDLASCIGLETARFSEDGFLPHYLARAFEYAHRPDIPEAKAWPDFLEYAIRNIRALRGIYADQEAPEQLIDVVRLIASELISYLKRHPEAMYQIRPRQFEELIAEILASYGWQVQLTPPTKDGGYDIYAISKDIEPGVTSSWIIECKKYAPENKVGVDIVRALYGVKADLKIANALLATTSYFTKGAEAFKASRYDIELKNYQAILGWVNQYRPNPNGKLYIKDNRLIVAGED